MLNKRYGFLLVFLLLLMLFSILLSIFYISHFKSHKTQISNEEKQTVQLQYNDIKNNIEIVIDDLILLSEHTKISNILEIEPYQVENVINSLQVEYKAFSMARYRLYDQLRFIDVKGDEIIRINFNNGNPEIVRNGDLQNKKDRYYFKDIISLSPGDIYISPMDLNVEKGIIEIPHKPMIRLGTPLYNSSNELKGIVVINYLAEMIIKSFKDHNSHSLGNNMLINRDGYWLENSSEYGNWAFMFPDSLNIMFRNDFENEWNIINNSEEGQFKTTKGLFTFTTIHPLPKNIYSSTGSWEVFKPSQQKLSSKEYYWKIVSFIPEEIFLESQKQIWNELIIVGSIIFLLTIFLSHIISTAIYNRIIAENALRNINDNLELKIDQRTYELNIAKKKAEESDRLKTAFINNISHEIRTPLNGIIGFVDLLTIHGKSKEQKQRFVNAIRESSRRLMEIVGNMMDIAKIEAGQYKVDEHKVNLQNICKDVLEEYVTIAKEKNVQLICCKRNSCVLKEVIIDKAKLIQLLHNIIGNAVKFTNEGSVQLCCSMNQDKLNFSVTDTGIGISNKNHEKIFERFYQVDIGSSRSFEGAGLGLSICKGIIKEMNGQIWLESEIGKGTTFHFTIPYKKVYVEEVI